MLYPLCVEAWKWGLYWLVGMAWLPACEATLGSNTGWENALRQTGLSYSPELNALNFQSGTGQLRHSLC
jgi:hypothetical protein